MKKVFTIILCCLSCVDYQFVVNLKNILGKLIVALVVKYINKYCVLLALFMPLSVVLYCFKNTRKYHLLSVRMCYYKFVYCYIIIIYCY